jgi:DNA-binding Lrp family transcriptional regulator
MSRIVSIRRALCKVQGVEPPSRPLLEGLATLTRPNVLELSRQLGLARNTVQARLDRLQASGAIVGFEPVLDLGALGYSVLAFSTLEIAQGQEAAVVDALAAIPEVLEVHKITGPGDLLCRIVARSNEHLHVVIEAVLRAPGIVRTTTSLALHSPVLRTHPAAGAIAALSG